MKFINSFKYTNNQIELCDFIKDESITFIYPKEYTFNNKKYYNVRLSNRVNNNYGKILSILCIIMALIFFIVGYNSKSSSTLTFNVIVLFFIGCAILISFSSNEYETCYISEEDGYKLLHIYETCYISEEDGYKLLHRVENTENDSIKSNK